MPVCAEAFSPFSSSTRRITTYSPWVKVCSASFVEADAGRRKAGGEHDEHAFHQIYGPTHP